MRNISKVIATIMLVGIALLSMSACGISTTHNTRQGCKLAALESIASGVTPTRTLPQCKGLSKEVRQSIAVDILEGK